MATDACMYCQVRDDMGGVSEFKSGKSPKEVSLSMKTDVGFSCDQLTTKRLSSLILQLNEVSNLRLRLATGIKRSL